MKKIYWIFSLLLMIMGINTAYAGVAWGGAITDPGTLKDGSKIIIHTNGYQNEANGTYRFLSAVKDSTIFAVAKEDALERYVAFTLESAAGKTVNGTAAFYLKNDYNGKYVTYVYDPETSEVDGHLEMYMKYTDQVDQATPVIIMTVADGAPLLGYELKDGDNVTDAMMILAECKEKDNTLIGINCNLGGPGFATYGDWAAWWKVGVANVSDDYFEDLGALLKKVAELNFIGGTDPGQYDKALVDAYDAAKKAANTAYGGTDNEAAKAAFLALEEAYLNLTLGEPAPVTAGYYRIESAYADFITKQGEQAIKTIYADNDSKMKWKDLEEDNASMVWEFIDRKDGTWLLYNLGTAQYVDAAKSTAQSAVYTMTDDSTDCGVTIKGLGQSAFNLIPDVYAIHTGGHSAGEGKSGDILAWNGGLNTGSAWYITSVPEDQIDGFIAIGKQNKLNRELTNLYKEAQAKYLIGSAFTFGEDTLVTLADYEKDPMVVYSNADHNTLNAGKDGSGYVGLLDNDTVMEPNGQEKTYWHSSWGVAVENPYLQFKLNKPVSGFAVYIYRRSNINQATEINFQVTNDTVNGEWINAGSITGLPANTTGQTDLGYQSSGFELDGEYQYVRVTWKSAKKFTHFAGFHFHEATLSPNCQNAQMGKPATDMKAALAKAAGIIAKGNATEQDIKDLQAAYDAYVVNLADPTELKNELNAAISLYDKAATPSMTKKNSEELVGFKAGEPGVYTDEAKTAFKAVVDEVKGYVDENDVNGTFEKNGIKTNLEKLTAAVKTFLESAPKLTIADEKSEGRWYFISYSQHYFDYSGTEPDKRTNDAGEVTYIRKGKLYVAANAKDDILNNAEIKVTGNETLETLKVDEAYAKWRFVNLGDTAYAIQNKATGLYIGQKTGNKNAGLSMTPAAFKISDLGYATFLIEGSRLNGESINPLHIQTEGQKLVYWANKDLGGGSCFDIESTTDAAKLSPLTYQAEEIIKGRLYAKSYPITLGVVADLSNSQAYPFMISTIDMSKKELTLDIIEDSEIEAGRPFFYIGGGEALGVSQTPTAADTTRLTVELIGDRVITATPGRDNGLIGNFYGDTEVAAGMGVVKDTKGVQSIGVTSKNQQMGWNSAYIDAGLIKNAENPGSIVVKIDGDLETSIKDAIINAQSGPVNVYSIDGVLIKKNVKASEATKGLAKGIYIVGNKKVAVQ